MPTAQFFASHSVFSLEDAAAALAPPGGRSATLERLKYHTATGRLKRVARETYAVVPAGVDPTRFEPDAFLVAATVRPSGVFSYHSALELLGAGHSVWHQVTLNAGRRRAVQLGAATVRFLDHPAPFRSDPNFGTRQVEHRGRLLRVTGAERTLVEGFRRPDLVGGFRELVTSASGFPVLDLELLEQTLIHYSVRKVSAAVGWFLERFQETFHVPDHFLLELRKLRPASPLYIVRDQRGGDLDRGWNLILPEELTQLGEPDER